MQNSEDTIEDLMYWRFAEKKNKNTFTHEERDAITIKYFILVDKQGHLLPNEMKRVQEDNFKLPATFKHVYYQNSFSTINFKTKILVLS